MNGWRWTDLLLAGILTADAIRDLARKKIWLILTGAAGLAGMGLRFFETAGLICTVNARPWVRLQAEETGNWAAAAGDLALAVLPGAFLMLMAWGTREKIGYGDGICVGMIGAWAGFWCGLISMISAMALVICGAAGWGIWMSARKRKLRGNGFGNREIPFVPFLLAGFLLTRVLGAI